METRGAALIVVDANVLVYHCLPGEKAALTEQVFRRDPVWGAPLLWRSEFRSVLAGGLRAGRLTPGQAEQAVQGAARCLRGGEHAVADAAVLEFVARSRCSAYDCEYAALAQALGTVLVTEDKALLTAFPKLCRSLEQFLHE